MLYIRGSFSEHHRIDNSVNYLLICPKIFNSKVRGNQNESCLSVHVF